VKNIYPYNGSLDNIDYLVTSYFEPPKQVSEDWKTARQTFDLSKLQIGKDSEQGAKVDFERSREVNFLLSIIGFDRNRGDIKISKVKFILEKDPWNFEFFVKKLKNVKRIFKK
jgi:hypothetical protein